MEESEQTYAIVQRDNTGLFTWFRDAYETSPFADGVVAVYRGTMDEVFQRSQDFEQANRGKSVEEWRNCQTIEVAF